VIPRLTVHLVAEAPPPGGCGPLGALDGDAGVRLSRLDVGAGFASTRRSSTDQARDTELADRARLAATLRLFDERENLLRAGEDFDPERPPISWSPHGRFAERWGAVHSGLRGRRVVLVGRVALVAGLGALPPCRWLRAPWGDDGPHEVCRLPHPSGRDRWYNDEANRALVGDWLADLRRFRQARDDAWLSVGKGRYHLATGDFDSAPVDEVRTSLLQGARGLRRFSGIGLDVLSHSNVVRAIVQRRGFGDALARGALVSELGDAVLRRARGAAVHDAHEPLVCDLPTPLKHIMRAAGDVWDDIERLAQVSVERLFRVVDLTPEDRAAIAEADRAALVAEAHAFGIGAGSWLEGLTVDEDAAWAVAQAIRSPNPYADWEAAWALAGGDP
jgi:hypothetical protein